MGLLDAQEHSSESFEKLSFLGAKLDGFTFEDCTFSGCAFGGSRFNHSRFLNCRFLTCDLSNATFLGVKCWSCHFENSKLLGVQWVQLKDFAHPKFVECNLSFSNFSALKLKGSAFVDCELNDVDFSETDLSQSDLKKSDFRGARFHHTNLQKADLRGAVNYLLDPTVNNVKGAQVSLVESQGILLGLGLKIS